MGTRGCFGGGIQRAPGDKAAPKAEVSRSVLLLGTALVTLSVGGVLHPSPAAAVDQIIVDTQIKTAGDSKSVNNSSKLTSTLEEIITNLGVARANTDGGSNPGASASELYQLVDLTQKILLNSDIDIINSGNIDPTVGIYAKITNAGIAFANTSGASNANGSTVSGDVTQIINLDQLNSITSLVTKNNSGDITADEVGIFTVMNTGFIAGFANTAGASNANGTAGVVTVEDLIQSANIIQTNSITSDIQILNSGDMHAGTGILAEINNQLIGGFANTAGASNANGSASVVGLSDLDQSIDTDQTNAVANSFSLTQTGDIAAATQGISVSIENRLIGGFLNAAGGSNLNGNGAVLTLSDLAQSFTASQANSIDNIIAIDNNGALAADRGIVTVIYNLAVGSFNNQASSQNLNGSANVVNADDVAQSASADQENAIGSDIHITNVANINAGDIGIQAWIDNETFGTFANTASFQNANGNGAVLTLDSITQSAAFNQANTIANGIAIENSGAIDPDTGIMAEIDNKSIGVLSNQATGTNLNGTAAVADESGLKQSLNSAQSNAVTNDIAITNSGKIRASDTGISASILTDGVALANTIQFLNSTTPLGPDLAQTADIVQTNTVASSINITNTGSVTAGGTAISARIETNNVGFLNQVLGSATGGAASGENVMQTAHVAQKNLIASQINIVNRGSIQGGTLGIYAAIPEATYTASDTAAVSLDAGAATVSQDTQTESGILIDNSGQIGAKSLFAIDTAFASTTIINREGGIITGFVDLTDQPDLFQNNRGGTFEARRTSDFGGGGDLFKNAGMVHTAADPSTPEKTAFVNLDRFENSGTISLQDKEVGDVFTLSNTAGGTDLNFVASGKSKLAVDAYLGGPGSTADNLIIQGNVKGDTELLVNNTNKGPGEYNPKGIPVAFVDGNVSSKALLLKKPIDAGNFDYDLFFVPTGSGFFELRSHPGGGSHTLPRLITATQDMFHTTSETWLDRTADLRVLLNGGAPTGPEPETSYPAGVAGTVNFTPAVWVKGSGTWLNQDDTATTTSSGRTYHYNLNRDLNIGNVESGIDFGKRGIFAENDMLVFGLLGGVVLADLDYDNLARQFDVSGGEAGGYATYLNKGLFVDTLLKAQFLDIQPQQIVGLPNSVNATTWGVRTDLGYRFGGFRGGPFVEPLATIAFAWGNLDDFSVGGNAVDFKDETNTRGRLGLRVGTSYQVWPGTTMEPFVIGSVWSTLSGSNEVTLTSTNTTFRLVDEPDDVWGVASAGVNFFNPSKQTSVFAKVDWTFGDETDGVTGRAGLRVSW